MNRYEPVDITEFAKKEAANFPILSEKIETAKEPIVSRVVKKDMAFIKDNRIKVKTMGTESISINKEMVDLRLVEQLVDQEQLSALGQIIKYMKLHSFDGRRTLGQAVELLYEKMENEEFSAFCDSGISGNLAIPRKQEIYEALNRCRKLLEII